MAEKQGHPKGLYALFFTEMWERLAFYTMVGLLLLYTTDTESGGLGMPAAEGNEIYGLYLAFVYFTPRGEGRVIWKGEVEKSEQWRKDFLLKVEGSADERQREKM